MLLLLFVTLTTAAEDVVRRGCRRGTCPVQTQKFTRSHQRSGAGQGTYLGDRHQLVVLVSFSDRQFVGDEAATMEQWDKIFNAVDYTEEPFVGSVHDYFYDQSYGQFNLIFDLQYVALSESCKRYRSTNEDDENSKYLVQDILDVLDTRDIDWTLYDWNGGGYIDQLLIVYAGKGMNDGGDNNSIWPHQGWLSFHEDCKPRPVTTGDQELYVDCYCAVPELSGNGSYGSFGTICHEYSHCFGLPDFYYGSGTKVVGNWDLMDFGNYNGGGFCPCGYSGHERMLMGWLTPVELKSGASISDLPSLSDSPQAYLLRNDGYLDEFYIVENRQQRGWDRYVPGNGIVVFHVDYDEGIWVGYSGNIPNNASKKRYHIFPANNRTSTSDAVAAEWPYPYQENAELTNTSLPAATLNNVNVDGTLLMSKPITNMTMTDDLASFDVMGGATAIRERQVTGKPQVLYDLGPIRIVRDANGTIKKVMKH